MTEYVYTFDAFMAMATEPKNQSSGMGNSTISQNEILSRFGKNVYTHAYTAHNISFPNNETSESNNSTMAKHQLSGPIFYFLGCPHGIKARRKHNRWYHIASLQSPCNDPPIGSMRASPYTKYCLHNHG